MYQTKENQEKFFDFVENSIVKNKKISHAYLIETNGYKDYNRVVLEFIKIILSLDKKEEEQQKINYQIDTNNYPDLEYIYPDGVYIKKDQMISLATQYKKKSMLENKLIYVIDPADKLNPSSANTILKFLEEPPDDVIAVLITENKYNVLETIVSRCQNLSLKNALDSNIDEELKEFINDMKNPKKILIKYDYYLERIFTDRTLAIENLKLIEEYLSTNIKEASGQNYLLKQIELIEIEKEKLQYNVNMKLWFSDYILNMIEVIKYA